MRVQSIPVRALRMHIVLVAVSILLAARPLFAQAVWMSQPTPPFEAAPPFGAYSVATIDGMIYAVGDRAVGAFDRAVGRWALRGAPGAGGDSRIHHATVAIGQDVYLVGGENASGVSSPDVRVFHTATSTWQTLSRLPTPRILLNAAAVGSAIYVLGGKTSVPMALNEAYDTSTNQWTVRAPLPSPRYSAAVTSLDGLVYVIGGFEEASFGWRALDTVDVYDPATDRWSSRAPLPFARATSSVAALDGKLYVTGGFAFGRGSIGDVAVYDPSRNTWSSQTSMSTARSLHGSTAANGRLYAIGGTPYNSAGAPIAQPNFVAVEALDLRGDGPGSPTNLQFRISGSSLTLTWRAPSTGVAPESYIVEAGSSPGLTNVAAVDTGSTDTTFSAPNVPLGTYYIRVRGRTRSGAGGPSNEVTVILAPEQCQPPSNLIATVTVTAVTLQWTGISGATSYVLEAGSGSGRADLGAFDLRSSATSFTTPRPSDGTYYVRVRAQTPCGLSSPSNEVIVTVGTPTSPGNVSGHWTGTGVGGRGNTGGTPLVLDLTQSGAQVGGTFTLVGVSTFNVTGSVSGTTFTFSSARIVDSRGCGVQLTDGSAQVSGTTMQGTLTVVNDISQACGTVTGPNTFAVQFSVTK